MIRIEADREACEGHGLCEQVAPAVYQLDDEGIVVLVHDEIDESQQAAAEAGARVCPVAALHVRR